MKLLVASLCAAVLLAARTPGVRAQSQSPDPPTHPGGPRGVMVASLRTYLAFQEKKLDRELGLLSRRASSEGSVERARADLALARCGLAFFEDSPEDAVRQLGAAIKFREAAVERATRLKALGTGSEEEIDAARRHLANARYVLAYLSGDTGCASAQLREVVAVCEREAASSLRWYYWGIYTQGEVESARRRLAYARYLLAAGANEPGEAVRHLREAVRMREAEFDRVARLQTRGKGAVGLLEVEFARFYLAEARHRLAVVGGDPDEAGRRIREAIVLYEGLLRSLPGRVDMTDEEAEGLKMGLAFLRYQKALGSAGYTLSWINPIWDLDI